MLKSYNKLPFVVYFEIQKICVCELWWMTGLLAFAAHEVRWIQAGIGGSEAPITHGVINDGFRTLHFFLYFSFASIRFCFIFLMYHNHITIQFPHSLDCIVYVSFVIPCHFESLNCIIHLIALFASTTLSSVFSINHFNTQINQLVMSIDFPLPTLHERRLVIKLACFWNPLQMKGVWLWFLKT